MWSQTADSMYPCGSYGALDAAVGVEVWPQTFQVKHFADWCFPQASRHLLRLNHVSERAPWAQHTCKYISGLNLIIFIGELVITVLSEIGLVFHLVLSILLVQVWRVSLPDFGSVCQALGPYRKAILMGLWNRDLIFLLNSATLGNYDSAYIQTRSVLGMFRIF